MCNFKKRQRGIRVDYRKPKLMLIALGDHQPVLQSADVWIAVNATLIGRVTLSEASSVWFGAVLRADNEPILIGAGQAPKSLSNLRGFTIRAN